jgi:lipopolysaccharide biosynthesis protein
VVGEHPEHFAAALQRAHEFRADRSVDDPLVLIASLNEWSEGHYLEPDERFGNGWLEAVRSVTTGA